MLIHHNAVPQDPSRVVILGAGGFVGRTLAGVLAGAAIPVLALASKDLDLAADGAGASLAALLHPGDAVVMLATITPDKGRDISHFLANLRMAAAVAQAVAKTAPRHLVYASSDAAYPFTAGLVSEDTPSAPPDLYAAMHHSRELILSAATTAPVAILRPTLIYGAADPHNSYGPNRLRRVACKDGKITLFGEGEEMRDHIYIDDVARLICLTLRHRSSGLLNLATGRSISYADLARLVAAQFDPPVPILGTPRKTPITHRHYDITALLRAFPGFVFTPLAEGITRAHRGMLADEPG